MRIDSCDTFIVGNPPPHKGGRYFHIVRLRTACGIEGVGEVYAATFAPAAIDKLIHDVFGRWVAGIDPTRIETFWRRAYSSGYTQRPDPTLQAVMSGLELALWDILGKALDQPVHALLGGRVHARLRSYTYLYPPGDSVQPADMPARSVYSDPDMAAEAAAAAVAAGFTAVKFDPAGPYTAFDPHQPSLADLDRTEAFCAAVRAAVGSRADLLVGTHGQFTPSGAIRLARRLEAYDPLWFEEPTPPEVPEEMAKVAAATTIPIATGERLTTKYEFAALLRAGAASILQPDLGRSGGLLEGKKIAGLAEAFHAQIAPHCYCGPVVMAANAQLAVCSPNFLIIETIEGWGGFQAELVDSAFAHEDGHLLVPDTPGLGVTLNEAVARAHHYTGTQLHLTMADDPAAVPQG
ncbi:MAG: mandelate racemase/muconate lactonizing enzyme family protein [Rhodospirillaceae bacterium]|nr:mandelate racemase/muconate lactonizing enzyme family protein [Rhodospirillaceae bacterium]